MNHIFPKSRRHPRNLILLIKLNQCNSSIISFSHNTSWLIYSYRCDKQSSIFWPTKCQTCWPKQLIKNYNPFNNFFLYINSNYFATSINSPPEISLSIHCWTIKTSPYLFIHFQDYSWIRNLTLMIIIFFYFVFYWTNMIKFSSI